MKKLFLNFVMAAALCAPVVLTSCEKDDDNGGNGVGNQGELWEGTTLVGDVNAQKRLDASKTYTLAGNLIINEGGELTIPAGTRIEANAGFEQYIFAAAQTNPTIEFFHATGYMASQSGLANFHNYFASIYEARYLSGIAAGLKTATNKIGYVAAFPFAEVISGFSGFYLGAKSVNPDVEMVVMYTNSWNDPTVEAQVAKALIDQGCDVIGQHSDSTAPATTAERNGVFQVGYNSDMIPAAPAASLISARIDWSKYLTFAVEQYLAGAVIPTDWSQGLADGAVYLSPLNEEIAAEGTADAIAAADAKLVSGELKVFAGPLTDADGNEVVAAGDFYPEQVAESAPSWDKILQGIIVTE